MKLLAFSDSHSYLTDMRRAVRQIQPDYLLHMGDYYADAAVIAQEFPQIPMVQVPGNCDASRVGSDVPAVIVTTIGGVRLMLTHGHKHHVKLTTAMLLADARRHRADAVLYGHTHIPDCENVDGMWVLNPGTVGYPGSTAGLITVENGKITDCRILQLADLEAFP